MHQLTTEYLSGLAILGTTVARRYDYAERRFPLPPGLHKHAGTRGPDPPKHMWRSPFTYGFSSTYLVFWLFMSLGISLLEKSQLLR